ncbi:MAG TPA: DUF6691 family protein [Nevskia sp.]|jgi:hypothetical protein|nr:DUF6691 family protein [Nevskia sp.]
MSASIQKVLPLVSGLLFGFGLILSGMTDPLRIQAFLDIAGAWNPAMALVMGGAIAVTLPAYTWVRLRGRNALGAAVSLPDRKTITPRLVIGSGLFGIGWGLSGVCPGPAILIAANGLLGGVWPPVVFLLGVLGGMLLYAGWSRRAPAASVPASVQANGL